MNVHTCGLGLLGFLSNKKIQSNEIMCHVNGGFRLTSLNSWNETLFVFWKLRAVANCGSYSGLGFEFISLNCHKCLGLLTSILVNAQDNT